MWLEFYLTPKRFQLKWNRLDYQPMVARTGRPDSKDWQNQAEDTNPHYMLKEALHS